MKKSLYITVALVLCLLIFCAACGESKQPSSDDMTTPDGTQDITPDNTQNVTPPDTTADDNKITDDPTPPAQDDPTPPVQDDPTPPAPPAQDDPVVPDTPTPPTDPDPQPPAQDEPKEPIPSVPYETPAINYSTPENTAALQAYYAFLTGEATAYDFLHEKTTNFNDIIRNGDVPIEAFGIVDVGADGIHEVFLRHENTNYSSAVLFYDDGKLYVDYIPFKGMNALHIFGIHYANAGSRTGSYQVPDVSTETGLEYHDIAGVYNSTDDTGKVYYICSTYENGTFPPAENRIVTKDEYDAYVKTIDDMPYMYMFSFTVGKVQQVFLDIK